ncbi:hypothetical protein DFR29_101139 [Tahibacter aquaticus]|uniref:Uncharacterized protein n=1 Tax=Tahibacter aquaticus TaxID=520092 RepID=A0A4R6ZA18_9GAMM|nr:putative DNA-binding domain-containing protein [Tahibacter aquaticus]TDR48519.1 hypothetical protein DFR29_101139 [Tahibacter aquaticus]
MSSPAELHALQRDFADCIRQPQRQDLPPGVDPRRMQVYRDLFYNNVEGLLSNNFPVIRSLYDTADWHGLITEFLRDHRAQTPLFPEIGRELMRWLEQRAEDGRDDPPFLLELAHYEWAELALSLDEQEISATPHQSGGDVIAGIPVVSPLAWVLGYNFPVQRIRRDYQPSAPPAEPTWLLLVRGRDDQVSFLEINGLTAALIERLRGNSEQSGGAVLAALLQEIAPASADTLYDAGCGILRNLQQREAILGIR